MMKIFYAALLLVGCSYAFTIPNGECQNFTLFNATDNSTNITEICAGNNTTIIYNVTNVTNLTIQQCNATTAVLWANSTGTFNNATISCLFNVTPPVTCTNTTTYVNVTTPIPVNYCYQNTTRTMGYLELYRNDMCNITITSPANTTTCPVCAACLPYQYYTPCETCRSCPAPVECPAQKECAAPRICDTPDVLRLAALENKTVLDAASIENLTFVLSSKEEIIRSQRDALNTLDSTVEKKVDAKTGNVNDMYGYALIAGLCCTVFFVYKSRQPQGVPLAGSGIGAAITKERLDNLRKQRGGDANGGNTNDVGAVEKSQPRADEVDNTKI